MLPASGKNFRPGNDPFDWKGKINWFENQVEFVNNFIATEREQKFAGYEYHKYFNVKSKSNFVIIHKDYRAFNQYFETKWKNY